MIITFKPNVYFNKQSVNIFFLIHKEFVTIMLVSLANRISLDMSDIIFGRSLI